jgi:hypothetical protein
MKEQQATQIQKTEMQEHTSYPGKTPTELADLTNRLADLVECDPQPLDESRKEAAAAQEPAAQEPKLQAEQELALDCLDTEPEEPFGMTAQEFWKRWESETWYFDIHGNIVEKDTRRDRLRRGEEVEPEPKWDEWGALDEGDGYQQ